MSDPINKDELENLVSIDLARIKRLKMKGHYNSLVDEYEKLRLKFHYEKALLPVEVIRFITLCKFFMENGHSESFKLSCKYLYERYMGQFGL